MRRNGRPRRHRSRADGRLHTGVVGVGYFGRFHAQKYAALEGSDLVAVVDVDPARARAAARAHGVLAAVDYRQILDEIDVVSVVTPAVTHYPIARAFLENGVHVLVEKPIAATLADASALVALAAAKDVVLQVGHQEELFTRRHDLKALIESPVEIVCRRTAPFTGRGTDCSVVMDLMIHDLEFVQGFVSSPLSEVDGFGRPVHSGRADEAFVTLYYANGCMVRLTASRASDERHRTARITQADGVIEVDFLNHACRHSRSGPIAPCSPDSERSGTDGNGLAADDDLGQAIAAFLEAVRRGTPPVVTGGDGLRALETALLIEDALEVRPRAAPRG
ncbi:MAG: Gfo/Idh/MocA family oxidoreductase [Alphaproteobacteria bacterium]